ncbi:hypothetical protein CROQUDRAFT_658068 [Cronartium quercuum f. sp. fusiforme G11]|uniref:Uncharacterized protein n=1 Tax=Cronartium quercuum f. sp. fusiforme G11 TaxID=708437 RepID=A0A9P6TBS6_9BASI|nr:hypothetical protein CROQUDRAFT_658068 [Cronartium quercuum f. sp. fusiforme G11]
MKVTRQREHMVSCWKSPQNPSQIQCLSVWGVVSQGLKPALVTHVHSIQVTFSAWCIERKKRKLLLRPTGIWDNDGTQ